MTAAELIAELQKHPADTPIFVYDYENERDKPLVNAESAIANKYFEHKEYIGRKVIFL
jgi:hypothetical protein